MKVAVLGCGPTGLLAAHACALKGVDFDIYSKRRKSELFGSQYLHNPIPLVCQPADGVDVLYITRGSPRDYRHKVHGKYWDGHIAPEDFEANHQAWDIRAAYNNLWQRYWDRIAHCDFEDGIFIEENLGLYDLVISTVPRQIWAHPGDEFVFSEGWALGDAPEKGIFVEDVLGKSEKPVPDNTIICDGTESVSWTRLSKVFGYLSLEWPAHVDRPHAQATRIRKPLHFKPGPDTELPNNWMFVGRYGQFEKGVVVTDAFDEVMERLEWELNA